MIPRLLTRYCHEIANRMPIITITGPRQSGKTTLAKTAFPGYAYANLEFPDIRSFARQDPRGFLSSFRDGVILDEIQNEPELLSYIQGIVDQDGSLGRFILTGSHNILLLKSVSQSLAGRSTILHLLPFSLEELMAKGDAFKKYEEWIWRGFYPRLYDKNLSPPEWLPSYIESYIERDVRSIINVRDLDQFQLFLRLCAGRIGQVLNYTSLGNDVGVDQKTVQNWISVLKSTFTVFLLQPYHRNFNKRLIKSPKLYFNDTGLACNLLGLRSVNDVETYHCRGSLFENFVIAELWKNELNRARRPVLYFWRDSNNHEVDCLYEKAGLMNALEIKSGKTVASDYFAGLDWLRKTAGPLFSTGTIIYGGEETQSRSLTQVIPWYAVADFQL
ncbi:MAG: ATP-binding protein [Chitinivibrionales bacterium]|nr:ATP-binding protein [Chitinivibrionales bacterium]